MENLKLPEYETVEGGITAPAGYRATGLSCGLKDSGKKDLGLIVSEAECEVAGAFTSNKIKASPVTLDAKRMKNKIRAIIVNSGNANCLTGPQGDADALEMARLTEEKLGLPAESVLVASTGVIGVNLPMDRVSFGIDKLTRLIASESNCQYFNHSIMTTDTRQKSLAYRFELGGKQVTLGIAAKGSGMMKPNVDVLHATMLVFITTDAAIAKPLMEKALTDAVEGSFNRISVDNDMSTNDSVFVMANGLAGNTPVTDEKDDYHTFKAMLNLICKETAKLLVKDGEGTNRVFHIIVKNVLTLSDAKRIARAIADSYLVKTAVFGGNPNWGRILAAIGYSEAKFNLEKIKLSVNSLVVFQNGEANKSILGKLAAEMTPNEVEFTIDLAQGTKEYDLWTSDLSYDYVKINAHYIS